MLNDVEHRQKSQNFESSLREYIRKSDLVEGQFIDPNIESAHREFVHVLALFAGAVGDWRSASDEDQWQKAIALGKQAVTAHLQYRSKARESLLV
jgi:hypothetical protein